MEKEILDILAEFFLDERLNDIMTYNQEYIEWSNQINELEEKLENMGMDKDEYLVINNLISLHIKSIDFYAKSAYKQGVKDSISLLKEMGLIEISKQQEEN